MKRLRQQAHGEKLTLALEPAPLRGLFRAGGLQLLLCLSHVSPQPVHARLGPISAAVRRGAARRGTPAWVGENKEPNAAGL